MKAQDFVIAVHVLVVLGATDGRLLKTPRDDHRVCSCHTHLVGHAPIVIMIKAPWLG